MSTKYGDIYQKHQKAGNIEERDYTFIRWVEPNQSILGKLEDIEEYESSQYAGKFNVFKFDTDEGRISCILGAGGTRLLSEADIGSIVAVVYKGTIDLPSGRRMKDFSVSIVKKEGE